MRSKYQYLPLTHHGLFGKGLEMSLERRKEQKDQLSDLLPEFTKKRKFEKDSREKGNTKVARENRKITDVNSEHADCENSSSRFSTYSGCNGILYRADSKCSSTHETNTITSIKFLESNLQRYDSRNSIYSTSKITSFLVDKSGEHAERPIFSVTDIHCYSHNRCFQKQFWGLCLETNFPRGMEFTPERVAYQLLRNESSLFDNKTFSESVKEQIGSDQEQQHKCCSVYKSPGRDKITSLCLLTWELWQMATWF
ncbi:unnamed protein product [Mytilus coruscus]|uniref:Uncharacterized protein n=1 Tax=Mytilus coruscus TaxID=42192 RepID=A0A6J8AQP0_MYTCO|nr:unnamed protein product [Mytilus coruscus]